MNPSGQKKVETFSLNEIMKKGEAVFFNQKKKKEVNLQDLKKSLTDALEKVKEPAPEIFLSDADRDAQSKNELSSSDEPVDKEPEDKDDAPQETKE